MKKYLLFLVALVLLVCLLPISAATETCPACGETALDADTVTAANRLERLHGYGYYFAILRPSCALAEE